jgi:hypothetical protein
MAFNIADFRANGIELGGARPSLFDVHITFPAGINPAGRASTKFAFTCRATEIPSSEIGAIDVPYFGRTIRVNGERRYPPWRVVILNDEDFIVRKTLEDWHYSINSIIPNVMDPSVANIGSSVAGSSYKCVADIRQYRKTGIGDSTSSGRDVIRTYKMEGIFPTTIGDIVLGWDRVNQIEEFQVEFAYDWWIPVEGEAQRESELGLTVQSAAAAVGIRS